MDATLSATATDDGMELTLTVVNDGTEPAEMTFRSGQRAEFVARADGEELWRWSAGRMFTQAISTTELAPGEELSIEAGWPDPPDRDCVVEGWVTADGVDARDEVHVTA